MATQRKDDKDFSVNEFLKFLDQDIAQGKLIPLDARYLEELKGLVKDVTVDLDQMLPDDEASI